MAVKTELKMQILDDLKTWHWHSLSNTGTRIFSVQATKFQATKFLLPNLLYFVFKFLVDLQFFLLNMITKFQQVS